MNIDWIECCYDDLKLDEYVSSYRGWRIYIAIPNGGILGAGITNQKEAYCFDSSTLKQDLFFDELWHIQRCKQKIDELFLEQHQGQLCLGLGGEFDV